MAPRESLEEILRLHGGREPGTYRFSLESFWGLPAMGDLLARLVLAAEAAGEKAPLASLHAVFATDVPAELSLDVRVTRRGSAVGFDVTREARPVCAALARFDAAGSGPSYPAAPPPAVPHPNDLPSTIEAARSEGWPEEYARGPFEFRRAGKRIGSTGADAPQVTWLRPRASLPLRAAWHTAALVFASEFYSHWPFEWRLGTGIDNSAHRLLDHAVWLHAAPRFDDWVLVVSHSARSAKGVAVARRELYSHDGALLGTAVYSARIAMTPT